jgi:hypothetical protein
MAFIIVGDHMYIQDEDKWIKMQSSFFAFDFISWLVNSATKVVYKQLDV